MNSQLLCTLGAAAVLAACGGGGGGGGPTADQPAATAAVSTPMAGLVVPMSMTWQTAASPAMQINVVDANGAPGAGAAVSISTYTSVSPHDGGSLRKPVAIELIDSGATGESGLANIEARLPAHLSAVLVVATLGDQTGSVLVAQANFATPVTVQLTR